MSKNIVLMNDLIKEISMGPFGSNIKVDNYVDSGVPVLNGANISGIKLIENSFNYVTDEKAKSLKKANARRGDIIVTHRGTLGQICYIPRNSKFEQYVISQSQFRVTLKSELVDPQYFVYYFHSPEGQKRLLANKSYVGVPALAQATSNFRLIDFPLPDLKIQQKIAAVLSALDTKIEINNRINAELESLAKTIYDYWFVQFDFPNEDGKPYKASGGEMVYHPELKRKIPTGWEVKELGDISKNIRNTIKEADINPDTAYIGLEHIPRKQIFLDSWSTAFNINSAKSYFNKKDILFGKLRPYFHKVGVAFVSGVCSTDILVLNSKKDDYFGFLLMIVSSDDFINYVSSAMEGTRMPRTKWDFMKKYLCAMPPQSLAKDFNEFLKPFISKMENNVSENQQLTQLRDWLLPLLMNGQITVE